MMMEYIKVNQLIIKSMDQENISLKMGIFIKEKCIKEKCKEKVNIYGLIKMYIKVLLYKIKLMDQEN